jgi:hypothetical protein
VGAAVFAWLLSSKAKAATPGSGDETLGRLLAGLSPTQRDIARRIWAEALRQGVPPELALATSEAETGFRNVKAAKGESYGPLQVHISWGYAPAELLNLDVGIPAGVKVLRTYLTKAGGDSTLMRLIYFCGPGYLQGTSCTDPVLVDRVKTRWAPIASRWGVRPAYPV